MMNFYYIDENKISYKYMNWIIKVSIGQMMDRKSFKFLNCLSYETLPSVPPYSVTPYV